MSQPPLATVLFIAGSSRSGSTLLEEMLADHLNAVNCGELRRIGYAYRRDRTRFRNPDSVIDCSCGQPVGECPFWQGISVRTGIDLGEVDLSSQLGRVQRALFKTGVLLFGPELVRLAARVWRPFSRELEAGRTYWQLIDAIAETHGVACVIDASKQSHQFLMLRVVRPDAVSQISLTRNGRAVMRSQLRAGRWRHRTDASEADGPDRTARRQAVRGWLGATISMMLAHVFTGSRRRFFLRYEDLCSDPDGTLAALITHFELERHRKTLETLPGAADGAVPDAWPDSRIEAHTIGGSPSRSRGQDRRISRDDRWTQEWSAEDEQAFGMAARWLNGWLGYPRSHAPSEPSA